MRLAFQKQHLMFTPKYRTYELVRPHQVLSLVLLEPQTQEAYQADAVSFIVVEREKTKTEQLLGWKSNKFIL